MKTRQPETLFALGLLLLAPGFASAGEFFIGGSIGSAKLSEDFDGLAVDDSSIAYRLVAGWQFNDYFALEGGYHNFGDFTQELGDQADPLLVSLSADGFTLGAAGSIPLGERLGLTGRAGAFFWNGSAEINSVSEATPEDTNLYVGAGVNFSLTDSVTLTADWTRYDLDGTASGVLSAGFKYRF